MRRWMAFTCIFLILTAGMANATALGEKTRHFEIYYSDALPDSGYSDVGRALENAYSEINGYLGACPDSIKVLVVGKKTMDKVGEHVEAFSAWNTKSSAIVLREETLKDKNSLRIVAEHEICHLGLNNILANKDSREFSWMEEGICMVLSKEPFSDVKVSKFIMDKGFLTPAEIAKAVDSEDYSISKNGYLQSYSLVKFMVKKFGVSAVISMLKCPETDFEKAFILCTGVDFGTFYRQWQAYVKSTATGWQEALGPAPAYLSFDLYMEDCTA
ncbi:peptidase MA family metallohydrolase [Methanocella conradii]|uniref:peptidase MA family metallohydrolase n=1 Tax=Methanocella conradii TaxID=1175444 RepID=UPI0020C5E76A|nr:hypothetical protein [Methanocella conradii]